MTGRPLPEMLTAKGGGPACIDLWAEWSDADETAAELEGWCMSSAFYDYEALVIQKDDDQEVFEHDDAALAFVVRLAQAGSERAQRALRISRLPLACGHLVTIAPDGGEGVCDCIKTEANSCNHT